MKTEPELRLNRNLHESECETGFSTRFADAASSQQQDVGCCEEGKLEVFRCFNSEAGKLSPEQHSSNKKREKKATDDFIVS